MIIPRLPPASSSINVAITVNERLRPYFTEWFNKTKKVGESPDDFALRRLKESALLDYIKFHERQIENSLDESLTEDSNVLRSEVD